MLLAGWLAYAAYVCRTSRQTYAVTLAMRFKSRIVSTLLVLLSYFYPSVAFTILSVFSCRYLDPDLKGAPSDIGGEVMAAQGWFWTQVRGSARWRRRRRRAWLQAMQPAARGARPSIPHVQLLPHTALLRCRGPATHQDLDRKCFSDAQHRALALGLGIPGALLLLAYPLLQAILLARRVRRAAVLRTVVHVLDHALPWPCTALLLGCCCQHAGSYLHARLIALLPLTHSLP